MNIQNIISVEYTGKVNGLGMMIGQYLEQNLAEFQDKNKQGRKLYINTSVEVGNGIATTIKFNRDRITIENGVATDTDFHLNSSYATLADILSGKANPVKSVINREIKVKKFSITKPFQLFRVMNFLKIPKELLIKDNRQKKPVLLTSRLVLSALGLIGAVVVLAYLFDILG